MEKKANHDSIISIGKEVECMEFVINIPPVDWPECCIYRVPKQLRKVNKDAYTPKIISIGPFHHHRKELRGMEMHKLRYLKDFFDRTGKSQENFLKIIRENEVKIRHCYSEDGRLNSKDFVKMILLDAIFIIELFLKCEDEEEAQRKGIKREEEKDYILRKIWLQNAIYNDLILLENQLPFFVLDKLYTSAMCEHSSSLSHHREGHQIKDYISFLELSRRYFSCYDKRLDSIMEVEVKHFTDLLRHFFCSPNLRPLRSLHHVYNARKLDDAGLKFKAVEQRWLLEIRLSMDKCLRRFPFLNSSWLLACLPCLKRFKCLKGMQCFLEVPPLEVEDRTECLLRNLMALEQCHYPSEAFICNYVLLLDELIDTKIDVDLLIDKKIIINMFGSSDAVATLINKLCIEIVVDGSCYSNLCKEINDYCDNNLNRIMATLKTAYFPDILRGTATVVGLIVLGFSFWGFLKDFVS